VKAEDTQPGRFYRPTRINDINAGTFYTRPKTLTAAKYTARLHKRTRPLTIRETFQCQEYRANPDVVLFTRHMRGFDAVAQRRYEIRGYVLMPPDYMIREVKSRPGYTERQARKRQERS